jgi:hypothetical protein
LIGQERKGRERTGKERKGKYRKGKEWKGQNRKGRKGQERKEKERKGQERDRTRLEGTRFLLQFALPENRLRYILLFGYFCSEEQREALQSSNLFYVQLNRFKTVHLHGGREKRGAHRHFSSGLVFFLLSFGL